MKKIALGGFIALTLIACNKTREKTVAADCTITEEIKSLYQSSAEAIYTRIVQADETHAEHNADILGEAGVNEVLEKFGAIVMAAESNTEIHAMVYDYGIHQSMGWNPSGFGIWFNLESNYTSMQDNWGATGYPTLDRLANDYGYTITHTFNSNKGGRIEGDTPLNMQAIVEAINEELDALGSAELNHSFGGSSSIEYLEEGSKTVFIYSHGWGDCPSGCIYHHFWKVKVDKNCDVTLVEQYGDDLPE